ATMFNSARPSNPHREPTRIGGTWSFMVVSFPSYMYARARFGVCPCKRQTLVPYACTPARAFVGVVARTPGPAVGRAVWLLWVVGQERHLGCVVVDVCRFGAAGAAKKSGFSKTWAGRFVLLFPT